MQNSFAKKLFAVGLAASTVAWAALPFTALAAAHAEGTNVKKSDGTIGMIIGGQFRPYTSAGAFLSYGFNSWGSVVDANADDLALPTGAYIAPQDGKVFCATATKDSDVKGECALITGGQKASFTSAAVFTGLGFSFARSQSGDSSFLSKTTNIDNTTAAHRPGVLVNNSGTVYLVGATGLLGIPDIATFNSWGYSFADVVPANAADKAMSQTGVMATRVAGQLSPTALTGGTVNPPSVISGSVSASLAGDSPVATSIVAGQAIADLAHFTFSGTGTVTQVVLKRIGVSADTTLSNVYLYNGNTKLTDAGSVSNSTVTFSNSNGLFTVNGSMTISVKSDIASSNTSGQTLGVQLASYTVANGSPATVAISGNLMTVATATLATVSLATPTATGASGNINAGSLNANLWNSSLSVGQRNVNLKYVAFKQVGSVSANAIQNLKLYLNGNQIGNTASIDSNGNVAFDLSSSPALLQTGSQVLELRGDIIAGSSYNYSFRIQTVSDIVLVDSNYGVNISATMGSGSFPATPGTTTISQGTVSVQSDASFTATQMVKNSSNVTLGSWTMKAYGEDVKVQNLAVKLTYATSTGGAINSTEGFNNLAVYVNGGMVGSSQSGLYVTSGTNYVSNKVNKFTFGSSNLFTIPAGTTVTVTVKGDLILDSSTAVTSAKADLITPSGSLQGVTSYQTSPSSDTTYDGVTLSVVTASATTAKNTAYAAQTIGPNVTKQKLGSFIIQASNAEGVKVTGLTTSFPTAGNNTANPTTTLANLYIVTPDFPSGTTPQAPQSSNNFAVNFTVAANQTATVDVYADVGNITSGPKYIQFGLNGTGMGASSNQTVYLNSTAASGGSAVTGQIITVGTGTLNTPTLQTSSPVASFVMGGASNQAAATFNFVANGGSVTIQEMIFDVTTPAGATLSTNIPVTSVTVGAVGSSAAITSSMVNASSTVSGLNIVVPTQYSGVDVPVTVNFSTVGLNGISSDTKFKLNLIRVKYLAGSTTSYSPSSGYSYLVSSNNFDIVGSAPTVTLTQGGTQTLSNGMILGTLAITANASGNIIASTVPFTIASTSVASFSGNLSLIDSATGVTAGYVTFANGDSTVTLTTANNIAAGTTKTYNIQIGNFSPTASANNYSISIKLGAATGFKFRDVNGGSGDIVGNDGTNTFIVNYPSNTISAHQ